MAGPSGGRLRRSWRRFRRRSAGVQVASVALAVILVVAVVFAVGAGSPAKPGSSTTDTVGTAVRASTSSAGVTAHTIRVVFPVSNLSVAGVELRLRRRHRVQRADQGHQALRQADQRRRWHQRPDDRRRASSTSTPPTSAADAGAVQGLDRWQLSGLRRPRRGRDLDGRQPAVHHPGGPHAPAQPVDDRDQLDPARRRPTCGGRGPTMPPSCRPRWTGESAPVSSGAAPRWG